MTAATLQADVQQLTEHIRDWRTEELRVDRSQRTVQNIALTGRESKNGYRYSEQALRGAVSLYENKPVFLDHAAQVSRPYDRSTRDLVGSIVGPRFESGRIRGDIQLLDTEAGRTFLALAESKNPAVGMSHVVLAQRSGDGQIVESIHDVVSVDAVVFPATTSTFRESAREDGSAAPGSLEALLGEIDRRLPEHVRDLKGEPAAEVRRLGVFPERVFVEAVSPRAEAPETFAVGWEMDQAGPVLGEETPEAALESLAAGGWAAWASRRDSGDGDTPAETRRELERLREQVEATSRERDALRERLEEFEDERRREEAAAEIDRLIEAAGLPAHAVTDLFREQLFAAEDEGARRRLIEERRALLNRPVPQRPVSRQRREDDEAALPDTAIVSAIKRRRGSVLAGVG